MRTYSGIAGLVVGLLAVPLAGCGGAEPGSDSESTGEAVLELSTVPTGAQCLQVIGSGGVSFNVTAALTAGASSASVSLGRLPLGTGTINANVYDVACSALTGATPSWIADTQSATFRVGVVTTLTLNLRANNPVIANANFVGNIVSLNAGYFTTALVMADGTARTTGNWYPVTSSSVFAKPTGMPAGLLGITPKAWSNGHGCARTATQLLCWGNNDTGQLGTGVAGTYSNTAAVVTGITNPTQVGVGNRHTCAVSGGSVWCLGSNYFGQLGNGSTMNSATPVLASLTSGIDQLTVGLEYACASTSGGVACWGSNIFGQLGDNTSTSRSSAVYPAGVEGTVSLSAGNAHTCAVRADGTVRCWGYNGNGQLGDGTTTQRLVPTQVPGITDAVQVSVGWSHTCVRRANGTVSCWGFGKDGELGDGTAQQRLTPTQVPGLSNVVSIAAGATHTCALLDDQRVFCWGSDAVNEAGDGATGNNYKISAAIVQ